MRPYRHASDEELETFRDTWTRSYANYPTLYGSKLKVLNRELDRRGAGEKPTKTRSIPIDEQFWFYAGVMAVTAGFGFFFGLLAGNAL